jgi:N-acetylmuramoyl-L-alanine amidase
MRTLVTAYEDLSKLFPTSGYSDNALWQAANLSMLAYQRFGDVKDRERAQKLFGELSSQYPSSSLAARARTAAATPTDTADADPPPAAGGDSSGAPDGRARSNPEPSGTTGRSARSSGAPVLLKGIHRSLMPDGVRITIDLESEVRYHQEEVPNPKRVFFDLQGVRAAADLQDSSLKFDDDIIREIRLGRHPQNTTRVAMDLDGVEAYNVYPMYSPYRLVVDFKRAPGVRPGTTPPSLVASLPAAPPATESNPAPLAGTAPPPLTPVKTDGRSVARSDAKAPLPSKATASVAVAPPATNSNGKFSLSRQLGLGVSRIVIDAGHGGHDPGTHGSGINESELTLDIALRVQKLLEKQPGIEVVMTRDTDVFIPLEERTAIANREGADLFLSIHANASRSSAARGIETYFLNFATNPEAEAVAARENAGSGQSMHDLPEIVKAIALNNKINESRDFAETVQKSMVKRLRPRNKTLRDLGVKQAPFVVLIGAGMPSVLAEMSFLTNRQEAALLKTNAYRQSIAQALSDAVLSYQEALKKHTSATGKKATF